MTKSITEQQAEQALAAIREQFKGYVSEGYEPKLVKGWESWSSGSIVQYAILWEDGAPYDWALSAQSGGIDEEVSELMGKLVEFPPAKSWPRGVWCEPYNGYILCLYPND